MIIQHNGHMHTITNNVKYKKRTCTEDFDELSFYINWMGSSCTKEDVDNLFCRRYRYFDEYTNYCFAYRNEAKVELAPITSGCRAFLVIDVTMDQVDSIKPLGSINQWDK